MEFARLRDLPSKLDSSSPKANVKYTILPDIDAMAATASLFDFTIKARSKKNSDIFTES